MSSDNELKKISKIYNSDKIEQGYIKYKIIYKFYTYLLFILNLIKKILLLRF